MLKQNEIKRILAAYIIHKNKNGSSNPVYNTDFTKHGLYVHETDTAYMVYTFKERYADHWREIMALNPLYTALYCEYRKQYSKHTEKPPVLVKEGG